MGLCPECLIKAGFPTGAETDTGSAMRPGFVPPSLQELAGFFPQLEILELIGKGGMGAVYKVRQRQLNRVAALKILPPGIGGEPAFAERFTREAQALAQLNHPGIVTLYEFGETNGLYYFLMEFVDGVSLRQLLQTSRVSTREALAIVPQICDALQFAHDQGVVHRDIKPENILLDRRGRVKVADFGLAKLVGAGRELQPAGGTTTGSPALTESGRIVGTPNYMAPEQLEHPSEVDHRADIYALGVVFYQMLTGELPGKRIEPPSRKVLIDVRLDEVVLRALERRPGLRYQQVSEVKTDVETIAAMSPNPFAPATQSQPASQAVSANLNKKTRRGAARYVVLAACAVVAVLGVLLLLRAQPIAGWRAPRGAPVWQGITGTWKVEGVGFAPWTFTLKADGAKVTGTVSQGGSSGGWATSLTGETPIYGGTVSGNMVSFKCDSPDGGRTISFSGVMAGDVITFTREVKVQPGADPGMNGIYGSSGATDFTAKRVVGSGSEPVPGARPGAAGPAQTWGSKGLAGPVPELPVPKIGDLTRVDRNTHPSNGDATTATYILKTTPHATLGTAYVIVTDQTNGAALGPLERLARFHQGSILHVADLGGLLAAAAERQRLISDLRGAKPRFAAIAPKPESFTESMLLGVWSVLRALGDDHQFPVFPGILAAPNQSALAALVDRSINYHPQSLAQVRPFVMGEVLGPFPLGLRSLQKVRMMRTLFAEYGCATHSLVISVGGRVTVAPATNEWLIAPGQSTKTIPLAARPALEEASLLLLFGHGGPGNQCSLDLGAFHDIAMTGKIVMSGGCFSAAPAGPRISPATDGPDGKPIPQNDESFAMRAVENGAAVVYANMRENAGFPALFPVLESWVDGLTVGEAYQRLMNAIIASDGFTPDAFSPDHADAPGYGLPLYVIVGDPALQPMAK